MKRNVQNANIAASITIISLRLNLLYCIVTTPKFVIANTQVA